MPTSPPWWLVGATRPAADLRWIVRQDPVRHDEEPRGRRRHLNLCHGDRIPAYGRERRLAVSLFVMRMFHRLLATSLAALCVYFPIHHSKSVGLVSSAENHFAEFTPNLLTTIKVQRWFARSSTAGHLSSTCLSGRQRAAGDLSKNIIELPSLYGDLFPTEKNTVSMASSTRYISTR